MRFFEKGTIRVSLVAERSEAREANGKLISELSSVCPKTPSSIKVFLIRTTSGDDVITADKTSKAYTAVVVVDIKKQEYESQNSFCKLSDDIFFHFRFKNFSFPVWLKRP